MNWIKNSITILVSLILSLLIAELIVRTVYPQNLSGSWLVKDDYGLLMNKSEGQSINMLGARKVKYSFENFGVRSSFKQTEQPKRRVLVLGDSFTFGWLLNVDDTYVELLGKSNDHMVFVNAATGGWGASDYTAYMETYCKTVDPDITLVVMNADDIGRMHRSSLYDYDVESNLVSRSAYVQTRKDRLKSLLNYLPVYQILLENSHLLQFARSSYVRVLPRKLEETNTNYKDPLAHFGLMNIDNVEYSNRFSAALFRYLYEISKNCGSDLRIIYSGIQQMNDLGIYPTLEFINFARKTELFGQLGIRFIDLTNTPQMTEYRKKINKFTIVGDNHPNETGAQLIYEAIHQSGILLD